MREQGYEAEATSRRTRGITRKREKSAIWHIESGRRANRPRTSKVQAYRIREAVNDIIGTTPAAPRPWEHAIQARQHKIRESWLELAEVLEKQPHPENTRLSGDIRKMVDNMPPVETGRDRMRRELLERFGEKREKTQTPESGIKKEQEPDRRKKRQERELER